jgi:hypothetical protein
MLTGGNLLPPVFFISGTEQTVIFVHQKKAFQLTV